MLYGVQSTYASCACLLLEVEDQRVEMDAMSRESTSAHEMTTTRPCHQLGNLIHNQHPIISIAALNRFKMLFRVFLLLAGLTTARDIVFPPVSGYVPLQNSPQQHFSGEDEDIDFTRDSDATPGVMSGLMTFANVPFVDCLNVEAASVKDEDKFDIAFLGAPFDTVFTTHFFHSIGIQSIRTACPILSYTLPLLSGLRTSCHYTL